ncbi:MAG: fumarylacetoacetate hydrolase family protein [Acetobacter sp.]
MTSVPSFLFPPPVSALPVEGTDKSFPVGRIWCVGRNYAEHSREMGSDPDRNPPFFFSKPADAITTAQTLRFPRGTSNLHHEVELVVALDRGGVALSPAESLHLVYGYALGLDMTRRDMQEEAKKNRHPWTLSKGFDESCPITAIRPAASVHNLENSLITLSVNGELRQKGVISDMIWSIAEMISALSHSVQLKPGDLIMTGTPAGVSQIKPGDVIEADCENVGHLSVRYLPD